MSIVVISLIATVDLHPVVDFATGWSFLIFRMDGVYVLGNTIKLPAPGTLCGDPGACVTLVGVTVNTNSLPAFVLIA